MGKKILLADDSITIQKVIELTFSDEDFDVVTVSNGRLALERVQEVRPDIVLCDIIMPEKDGYEVCDFVKRSPGLAHIPVLLLTGAFEPFDQERAARVGCDGFLAKPFEPQTLIAKVKDLLAQAASRPAPRPVMPPPAPLPPPPASAAAIPPPPAPEAESFFEADGFEVIAPAIPVEAAEPTAAREAEPEPIPVHTGAFIVPDPLVSFIPEEPFENVPLAPAPQPPREPVAAAPPPPPAPSPPAEPDVHGVADEIEASPDELMSIAEPATLPEVQDDTSTVMFRAGDAPWAVEPTREVPLEVRAQASVAAQTETSVFEEVFDEGALSPPPDHREPRPLEAAAPPAPVPSPEPIPPPAAVTPEPARAVPAVAAAPMPPLRLEAPVPWSAPPAPPEPEPAPAAPAPAEISFHDLTPAPEEENAAASPSEAGQVAVPREMVETIAQRVVAQISERVVREVAWEVIPDLAEALIKKEIERLKAELQQA
jgi:CheY-like chemotaxis protein